MDKMKERDINALITDVRSGTDAAFSELLERYAPMLNKVVAGFSGSSLSHNEAISEAYVAFHRAVLSYDLSRSDVTFGLYARICVYRRLLDATARASKESIFVDYDMDSISVTNTVEERIVWRERFRQYIETARTVLSDYEYRVFILYIDGYSTAETAKELSKSAKSVDNAKARCFKRLREESFRFSDI